MKDANIEMCIAFFHNIIKNDKATQKYEITGQNDQC